MSREWRYASENYFFKSMLGIAILGGIIPTIMVADICEGNLFLPSVFSAMHSNDEHGLFCSL